METSFSKRVWEIVLSIRKGKTLTYKEVAKRAGLPKAARAVGNILNRNKDLVKIPCHRVVKSDGTAGGYAKGEEQKIRLLKKEGIKFNNNKIK